MRQSPVVLREARALRAEYDAALIAGTANQWAQLREQADPRLVAAWTELDAASPNPSGANDPGREDPCHADPIPARVVAESSAMHPSRMLMTRSAKPTARGSWVEITTSTP